MRRAPAAVGRADKPAGRETGYGNHGERLKLKAGQLASHLEQDLAACYLVTGDEHLLVDEALDQVRAAARARGFGARELHVAEANYDWSRVGVAGANLSLFAEKRIVEIRLPTGKPGRAGGAAIAGLTERLGQELMLVVSGPKLDRKTAATNWVKSLAKHGVHVPIWSIGVRELPGWIAVRMRRAGLRSGEEAARLIADRVEGNLLAAQQEIEKLRLLFNDGDVTAADVAHAVADNSRYDVYKLADAALAADARRALKILSGLEAEGASPVLVAWSLTRELRTLAVIADKIANGADLGTAMRHRRVWETRKALIRAAARRLDREDLYRLLRAVGQATAMARGQVHGDPWQLLADIIFGMAAGRRAAA